MDSAQAQIRELLEFDCVRPLRTVGSFLDAAGAGALLDDPLVAVATAEIDSRGGRPRCDVQRDIKAKERARAALAKRYRCAGASEEDILWALYSIGDNNSYLLFNRWAGMVGWVERVSEGRGVCRRGKGRGEGRRVAAQAQKNNSKRPENFEPQTFQYLNTSQHQISNFKTLQNASNPKFKNSNSDPVDRMIAYFTAHFRPDCPGSPEHSLAISGGRGGARLTHSHERCGFL